MKTGIIVARFQTSYLHEGHVKLIRYVSELSDRVIIFLGTTIPRLTYTNPLSFEVRKKMVQFQFPNVEVYPIQDCKTDNQWNILLDNNISRLCKDENIILYGDRESFIENYKGKYNKAFAEVTVHGISATKIRMGNHMCIPDTALGRAAVIWASEHKYPISYQTVDVAIVSTNQNKILLGRKDGESKYRFIGGFVDPEDQSLELAAKREVIEECGKIETDAYRYISSFRIDDWRYRKEKDKIMTAFFISEYIFGHVEASDDIAELKWFDLTTLTKDDFEPEHHILFNALITNLKNKT